MLQNPHVSLKCTAGMEGVGGTGSRGQASRHGPDRGARWTAVAWPEGDAPQRERHANWQATLQSDIQRSDTPTRSVLCPQFRMQFPSEIVPIRIGLQCYVTCVFGLHVILPRAGAIAAGRHRGRSCAFHESRGSLLPVTCRRRIPVVCRRPCRGLLARCSASGLGPGPCCQPSCHGCALECLGTQ